MLFRFAPGECYFPIPMTQTDGKDFNHVNGYRLHEMFSCASSRTEAENACVHYHNVNSQCYYLHINITALKEIIDKITNGDNNKKTKEIKWSCLSE